MHSLGVMQTSGDVWNSFEDRGCQIVDGGIAVSLEAQSGKYYIPMEREAQPSSADYGSSYCENILSESASGRGIALSDDGGIIRDRWSDILRLAASFLSPTTIPLSSCIIIVFPSHLALLLAAKILHVLFIAISQKDLLS